MYVAAPMRGDKIIAYINKHRAAQRRKEMSGDLVRKIIRAWNS
jgi:hypothetical protein